MNFFHVVHMKTKVFSVYFFHLHFVQIEKSGKMLEMSEKHL